MHRAYQPITPANNIFLKHRWDQARFDTHRQKVNLASAVIDNKPPKTYMHLHVKLKKLQMEEERLAIVERDNRILLEKMAHIMRTWGNVDNHKDDYQKKSLNRTKRQRELLKITHENLAILKRITSKGAHYNHQGWDHQWKINQQYKMNISKFPHHWKNDTLEQWRREKQAAANSRIREQVKHWDIYLAEKVIDIPTTKRDNLLGQDKSPPKTRPNSQPNPAANTEDTLQDLPKMKQTRRKSTQPRGRSVSLPTNMYNQKQRVSNIK